MEWKRVNNQSEDGESNSFTKWRTEGQELIGIWRGKKIGRFGFFGILETNGEDILFSMPTVLTRHLKDIPEGIEIRIIYLGKKQGKSGRTYHDFELYKKDEFI